MADMEYGAYHAQGGAYDEGRDAQMAYHPGILSKAMSYFGAASSVALVIGLGIWGYQLTMRDVSDVPVIRALEGPARVQPADPGGQLAQHQGLAVNDVQAEGEAAGPAPQVILAPAPIELTQDDITVEAPLVAENQEDDLAEAIGTVVALSLEEQGLSVEERAELLASRLAEGVEPIAPLEGVVGEVVKTLGPPVLDASVPGVKASQRPLVRPKFDLSNLQQTSSAATTSQAASAAVIQEAKSGGRVFYRLRAVGFDDLNASRRFCAVLVASNAACIPVLAR